MGRLGFYGQENGQKSGWAKDYDRAMGSKEAEGDPFALHIDKDPVMKELYVDNEQWDGYQRDQNVFAPGISESEFGSVELISGAGWRWLTGWLCDVAIEDDMSVLVQYKNGVTMTYHLGKGIGSCESFINSSTRAAEADVPPNVDPAGSTETRGGSNWRSSRPSLGRLPMPRRSDQGRSMGLSRE
jgi:hypothetical protein